MDEASGVGEVWVDGIRGRRSPEWMGPGEVWSGRDLGWTWTGPGMGGAEGQSLSFYEYIA